jgi:hypothetical protein
VVASLVGLSALTVAAPAVAAPTETPPATLSGVSGTASVLQAQGFVTPKVFYRITGTQDIVVVYDGGGPADPGEAIRQIEGTIWGHERFRFDQLVIQNGYQAPITISYADLEATIGPRPPGFGDQPLSNLFAGAAGASAYEALFTPLLDILKVAVAVIGVITLITVLAFGIAILGGRKRLSDEPGDPLSA